MARRGPRGLTAEDRALWDRVAQSATPLHDRPAPSPVPKAKAKPQPDPAPPPAPLPAFRIGATASRSGTAIPAPPRDVADRFADQPLRMDAKAFARIKRGKAAPDGRIDLHGKTADAARSALTAYLLSAHARGARLILVITGKGRDPGGDGPIPARKGVLRESLPHWLSTPPLASVVLQTVPAHRKHGGAGAFYVYLKRPR